jgi:hypothetical protein
MALYEIDKDVGCYITKILIIGSAAAQLPQLERR